MNLRVIQGLSTIFDKYGHTLMKKRKKHTLIIKRQNLIMCYMFYCKYFVNEWFFIYFSEC